MCFFAMFKIVRQFGADYFNFEFSYENSFILLPFLAPLRNRVFGDAKIGMRVRLLAALTDFTESALNIARRGCLTVYGQGCSP